MINTKAVVPKAHLRDLRSLVNIYVPEVDVSLLSDSKFKVTLELVLLLVQFPNRRF